MPRNRRSAQIEEPAESYLGSVSDLMAGLVFIFVITLAAFALRLAETTTELTNSRDRRDEILTSIRDRLEKRGVTVQVLFDQGILRLTEKGIYFPPGRIDPRPSDFRHVGELARVLQEILPCYVSNGFSEPVSTKVTQPDWCPVRPRNPCLDSKTGARVETLLIEGHTDTQPIGAAARFRSNLELSSMRAGKILEMMMMCEPELENLRNTQNLRVLSVSGYGESRLVRPDDERSEENRRIDLRFLMELPRSDGEPTPGETEPPPLREVRERYER